MSKQMNPNNPEGVCNPSGVLRTSWKGPYKQVQFNSKTSLLLFTILFRLATPVFSQSEFRGGLAAGPVTSQISGDGLGGWDKFGFTAGGWVYMSFTEKTGMTLGMQYINKGSKKPADPDNNDFAIFRYNLNYIDVPLMFTWQNVTIKKTHLQVNLGLYAGVLVKQNQQYDAGTGAINPPFRNRDFGGVLGAALWLGEKTFLELRSTTSIIPTRPAPNVVNPTSYYERGNYNQVLMLMVGWRV